MQQTVLSTLLGSALLMGVSATALASADLGFYIGGQVGYSNIHYDRGDFMPQGIGATSTVDKTGLGGRAFIGYQINPYAALEAGYTRYHTANASFSGTTQDGHAFNGHDDIKQDAYDIVGKALLPINDMFDIYGKLGAAYVQGDESAHLVVDNNPSSIHNSIHKWRPTYGLGVDYNVTPNVPVFVDWSRVQKGSGLENADLISVGVAYHFG